MYCQVVIPSFGRLECTERTLFSLREKTVADYRVTVVDNGSGPEVVEALERWHSDGLINTLIKNRRNMGVAVAANAGWLDPQAYYCKLDNDIEILSGRWLQELMQLQVEGGFGPVSCCFFEHHKEGRGSLPSGLAFEKAAAIHGAAVLISPQTHALLGFWNEDYIYGWEDLEYSNRARLAGLAMAYPAAADLVLHQPEGQALIGAEYQETKQRRVAGAGLDGLFSLNTFMFENNLRPLRVERKFLYTEDAQGFRHYHINPEYKSILARQKLLRQRFIEGMEGRAVKLRVDVNGAPPRTPQGA